MKHSIITLALALVLSAPVSAAAPNQSDCIKIWLPGSTQKAICR